MDRSVLVVLFCVFRQRLDIFAPGCFWICAVKGIVGCDNDILYILVLKQILPNENTASWIYLAVHHVVYPQFLKNINGFFNHGGVCFGSILPSFPCI